MPETGIQLMRHDQVLSFEEIAAVVRQGAAMGITKVRLTGGEPLVRKGIVDLVGMLAVIPGIRDLSMTTNGALLDIFAKPLAGAGLNRVNISLDTLDPDRYREITRVGDLQSVLLGIESAIRAGLDPVKINCVIKDSPAEPDAVAVARFGRDYGLQVRFIREMDLEKGVFSRVIGGDGGHCASCNRLRLTADGKIKPCLFSDLGFDVRELGIEEALNRAIGNKPKSGSANTVNRFSNIGG
jgi:cyclic pyranopterin phosphate synthase